MKITKSQLKQIIKEELKRSLVEVSDPGPPPFNYSDELKKAGGDKSKIDPDRLKQYRTWYTKKQAFKKSSSKSQNPKQQQSAPRQGRAEPRSANIFRALEVLENYLRTNNGKVVGDNQEFAFLESLEKIINMFQGEDEAVQGTMNLLRKALKY